MTSLRSVDSELAQPRNMLLRALPPAEFRALEPHLEECPLRLHRILHHAKLPVEHVYFVESGLVSTFATTDLENHDVEAWLIGHEGLAGIGAILGADTSPHSRVVLAEGRALRMRTSDVRKAMSEMASLRSVLMRFVNSILIQAGQTVACNARHSIAQRIARLVLMVADRSPEADLPLTHDSIARMLGVRRASVTGTMQELVRTGAIGAGGRGLVMVLDRSRLEALSCNCYRVVKTEFDRLNRPLAAGRIASAGSDHKGSPVVGGDRRLSS